MASPRGSTKAGILVVDDHPENILALRAILDREDFEIVEASSGEEALRQVLKRDFAVILLDVLMPRMDGFETARFIRERDASRDVPIIFLTAAGTEISFIYKGYSVGAVDYLVKPVDADIVRAKVAIFVELWRKNQQLRRQEQELRENERRESKRRLEESEAQYEATFEQAPVGIAHASIEGFWLRANDRFCALLGSTREELQRLSLHELLPAERAEVSAGLARLMSGQAEGYRAEGRLRGGAAWVELTVSLLRDEQGEPQRFIVAVVNATERRRDEQRQRFLTQAAETLLSSLDYQRTVAQVAQLAVPGFADACAVDLAVDDGGVRELTSVPGDFREERAQAAESVLKSGRAELLPGKNLLVVPLLGHERAVGALTLLSRERRFDEHDLTTAADLAHRMAFAIENARLYREAQEAIAARDEFLSIASHELRTPLTPLQLLLQRMLVGPQRLTAEELKSALQRSERQVQRLAALTENLLDVSRISSGGLKLNRETVDLAQTAHEVGERFRDAAARAGSQLEVRAEGPIVGNWDSLRVEQVLTNLVTNAMKYGNGQPIALTVEQRGDAAHVEVRDHGIGIDPRKQARIFDRFERAVSPRSYGGLGLGLYIARQIVEAHAGTIRVQSAEGEGSLFTVELPLALELPAVHEPPQPAESVSSLGHL